MAGQPAPVTLWDDWQTRRARLAERSMSRGPYVELQIQILDYLVQRYRDSPEAAQPARCPARPELFVNDRAIVVHDHLWEGKVGGVKTHREAADRVSSILRRMACVEEHVEEEVDEEIEEHVEEEVGQREVLRTPRRPTAWLGRLFPWKLFRTKKVIRAGAKPARRLGPFRRPGRIERAVEGDFPVGDAELESLLKRLLDPKRDEPHLVDFLLGGDNPSVVACAALAWRERVAARCYDETTRKLRGVLFRPDLREEAVEKIGAMLADRNARVRLKAIAIFGKIGSLEHVGLLSDLLNLPPQDDEHPRERDALIRAMQSISRRGEQD